MRYIWLLATLLPVSICSAQNTKKQISLEDVWKKNTFKMKSVPGFNAMNDGLRYTQIDAKDKIQEINIYNLERGEKGKLIFNNDKNLYNGQRLDIDNYAFAQDEKKLLLNTESENIYRRSVLAKSYIFDMSDGKLEQLEDYKVLHASFSEDGSKVAFVKENNLYYKDLNTRQTIQVTNDGKWNEIINGNCDWVYEEEFEFTKAYEWSPNGRYIAYYRFDESAVPMYTLPIYTGLYPTNYTYKYPKAGEPNSVVQIKIYDVQDKQTITVNTGKETDQYIPRIKWTKNPNKLCVYRMNRLQNKLELLEADAETGATDVMYSEENPYYIEVNDNLAFLTDGRSMIFNSERDGYNHLYYYDWKKNKLINLTPGEYDIDQITGVDEKRKLVYYTAAQNTPLERKLYSVDWKGKKRKTLTPEGGTHAITPIQGYNYFLDKYSQLTVPPVFYLRDASGKIVRTLEDNSELKQKMSEYDMGRMFFTKVNGASDVLNAWVILPPNFDSTKKYPVLMYQYSGPGSQEVADRFPVRDYFWHHMMAQKGYIIVCADGTGTGYRGEAFKKKTYLQLGKYESDDQIAVAKNMAAEYPYVDKNRIGIWGWSYGGFMSSTCILKGNDIFKTAIAVAPVTNWKYYDNIYTERYMRTPAQNEQGYEDNAPEKMAGKLQGKFLMIHGTGDDNVHFQNAIMLTDALINANKEFESEYYPNKKHGISGGITRYHLYKRMTDFLEKNL